MSFNAPTKASSGSWVSAFFDCVFVESERNSTRAVSNLHRETRAKARLFPRLTRWLAAPPGYEVELNRLALMSEQRRMAILVPLLTGLTLLVVGFGLVAHSQGALPAGYGWILLIGCLACAYEW